MEIMKIRLSGLEDVKEFVTAARKCEFDIDVSYERAMVDGKSVLGIFALGLERELTVCCHEKNSEFKQCIEKFMV